MSADRIKNTFENMSFGDDKIDQAIDWLKTRNNEIFRNSENKIKKTLTRPFDGEFLCFVYVSENFESDSKLDSAEIFMRSVFKRLAEEIKKNETLICQMEYASRGILQSYTKCQTLPLLINSFEEFNWTYMPEGLGSGTLIRDSDSILHLANVLLKSIICQGLQVFIRPKVCPTAALILELAFNVGYPKQRITVSPIEYTQSIPSSIEPTEYGTIIVFEYADLHSACDCIMQAVWGFEGMIMSTRNVYIQENIKEELISLLNTRMKSYSRVYDFSIPDEKILDKFVRKGLLMKQVNSIYFYFINGEIDDEYNDEAPLLAINTFRTINEVISLINSKKSYCGASIWCENLNTTQEMAKKLNLHHIWINSYGHIILPKKNFVREPFQTAWSNKSISERIKTIQCLVDEAEPPRIIKAHIEQILKMKNFNGNILIKDNFKIETYFLPIGNIHISNNAPLDQILELIIWALVLGNHVNFNSNLIKSLRFLKDKLPDVVFDGPMSRESFLVDEIEELWTALERKWVWYKIEGQSFI